MTTQAGREMGRLTTAQLAEYWATLSDRHLARRDGGRSVTCYAGMPDWFNRFIDHYQRKAFLRLLRGENFAGCRVLDLGTGVGRWARWYAAWPGTHVVGIDIEPRRLALARTLDGDIRYELMSADRLAFASDSFDVVSCVTVLQHVDGTTKGRAIAEMARVLRPGGRAFLFELIDPADDAPHVFPWTSEQWLAAFRSAGFSLVRAVGEQYTPLLRMLKRAHRALRGPAALSEVNAMKSGDRGTLASQAMLAGLRLAIPLSYPLEEACRFLPPRFARIGGFLWTKDA